MFESCVFLLHRLYCSFDNIIFQTCSYFSHSVTFLLIMLLPTPLFFLVHIIIQLTDGDESVRQIIALGDVDTSWVTVQPRVLTFWRYAADQGLILEVYICDVYIQNNVCVYIGVVVMVMMTHRG